MSDGLSSQQGGADGEAVQSTGDDTAAFLRFYHSPQGESRGLLYRLFVGWWRGKGADPVR